MASRAMRRLLVDQARARSAAKRGRAAVTAELDEALIAEASNGREAVEQFRRRRPDLTLMDLQMPEMNGVEAMIAIREEFLRHESSC